MEILAITALALGIYLLIGAAAVCIVMWREDAWDSWPFAILVAVLWLPAAGAYIYDWVRKPAPKEPLRGKIYKD